VSAAVLAGKVAGLATRLSRRGGGTALPGLVAERFDPDIAAHLGRTLGRGSILVTGTNGKTTTSRMIAKALDASGVPYIHNREGSNLMRGIASTLVGRAGPTGSIANSRNLSGLFETDEATLPAAVAALQPKVIVFTNLFRDQLDRYGEVDSVAALWRRALEVAPSDCTLALNADDPSVAELATAWPGPIHWFGLDDPSFASETSGAFDARWCSCGGDYAYDRRYFAHVGIWRCTRCDRRRPQPDSAGTNLRLALETSSMEIAGLGSVSMPLTGLYNAYNALAATAACRAFGTPDGAIREGLESVEAAFGRQEVIPVEGRRLRLFLAKNPAGANQVMLLLQSIARESGPLKLTLLLNDRIADGHDVSWIWDVDYEPLGPLVQTWCAGGDRAEDVALRVKYAGWSAPATVSHSPETLLAAILAGSSPGDDIFIVPTYTAMLDLREALAKRGVITSRLE
jgi:UDP-N-acetylmuramyl tripeptide synthase